MDYYSLDLKMSKGTEGFHDLYQALIMENGDIKVTHSFELRRDLKLIQMLHQIEKEAVVSYNCSEETAHIELGKVLYNSVFSGELGDYFNKRFNEIKYKNRGLRLSLQFNEDIPEIASLPWEYLHNGEDFLVISKNFLLSRLPAGVTKIKTQPIDSILRMLVVISNPDDPRISHLNTEKEQEIILESLDTLYKDKKIKIDFTEDATFENVNNYLNEQKYHIVHFTGHGINIEGKGHLVFETKDRKARLIDNGDLKDLFSGRDIRLIVLSSCESAKGSNKEAFCDIASNLSKIGVPAVVAMQYSVNDDAATMFAANFYKAIANGESVDAALNETRIVMKDSNKNNKVEFGTPVIYLSDYDCLKIGDIKEPVELVHRSVILPDLQVIKTGFVAREKELRTIETDFRLALKRTAIIYGFGGIGKTVLASRLALKMGEYFDGIFGMKCTSTTRLEDILIKINDFLMVKGIFELNEILNQHEPLEVKVSLLIEIFNRFHFLIIFDNFEDCIDEDQRQIVNPEIKAFIEQLLSNTISNTKFIITTSYDFDPLEGRLPESIEHISLPELQFPQANWLMNNYTKLADLSIRKKKEIYNVIGGHPWIINQLAILASSPRANDLFSSQRDDDLLMELESLQKKLIKYTRLDKSYSRLDENARRLLLCASIYEEAIPIEALIWIVGDDKDENCSVEKSLRKLVQWGLISKENSYEQATYAEHTLVRNFLNKKLSEEKFNKKQFLIRAARYYEDLFSQTENLWNLLKARSYYFQAEEWENANEIVEEASDYLIRWGYIGLAMDLLDESIKTTAGYTQIKAMYKLATILYRIGDFTKALKIYFNIKYVLEEQGDFRGVATLLHAIGMIYQDQGNYEEAVKMYDESLKIEKKEGDKSRVAEILHQLGNIHYLQGNYIEGINLYNQSLEIFMGLGNKNGVAITLYQLGMINQDKGNYTEAVKKYNQSLKISEELGDKCGAAETLHSLGNINYLQGNYEEAVRMYTHSLTIFENLNNKNGIATTEHQLGVIHQEQGNYAEAVKMFNKSLKIKEQIGNKNGIALTKHALGNVYCLQGNYVEGLTMYNQSLKLKEELGDKSGVAGIQYALGGVYCLQGNHQEGLKMYNQALKTFENLEYKNGIALTLHAIGMVYQDQGNYEEAVKMYDESLKIDQELNNLSEIATTLHQLGAIYEVNEEYELALQNYSVSFELLDNLRSPYKKGIREDIERLKGKMEKKR